MSKEQMPHSLREIGAKPSDAMEFLSRMWRGANGQGSFSYARLNQGMHAALRMAIEAHHTFEKADFEEMGARFSSHRWIGCSEANEQFYSLAIKERNPSAYQSYEAWKKRKPYILDGQRISCGWQFAWNGEVLRCSSFNDEAGYLVAVAYDPPLHPHWANDWRTYQAHEKVKHIRKISHADLREYHKQKRDALKEKAEVTA